MDCLGSVGSSRTETMAELQDRSQTNSLMESTPQASAPGSRTMTLAVEGMTCASCVRRVERSLSKVPGVAEASVNLATERATVTFAPDETTLADLIGAVEKAGYGAEEVVAAPVPVATETGEFEPDAESVRRQRDLVRRRNTLALGIALSIPVIVLSMFFMNRFPGENWLLLAL